MSSIVPATSKRRAADHADLGLAIFIVPEPGDIFGDDQIIAATRV